MIDPVAGQQRVNVAVRGLSRRFGNTEAVKRVNLEIGPGVLGLLGPNGAGKTTLSRLIATVLSPSSGSMRIFDLDALEWGSKRTIRRRMGYLPQHFGYYPNFTVTEFVQYVALLKEIPPRDIQTRVRTAIERVGLQEVAGSQMKKLSGGTLRRAGIAQAIVNEPALLLLDEPTAGLDPEQRVRFRSLVREIGAQSTVVICTHLVEDVAAACTHVAVMHGGRIRFQGTPASLEALGEATDSMGDTAMERGYHTALATVRPAAR